MPTAKPVPTFLIALALVTGGTEAGASQDTLRLASDDLTDPVEIIRDRWGISHIYAETEHDLFFAQGFNAARDRLFQLEIWRRQATGTVAAMLGRRELERDIGTRLFMFRGDIVREMNHYHPSGDAIITAFVRGVNAYISLTEEDASLLPLEFQLLGITPGKWTPGVVISRHQGLLGNIGAELNYGRAVALLGPDRVKQLSTFGPGNPNIALDPSITADALAEDILRLYNAFRQPIQFVPDDIASVEHRGNTAAVSLLRNSVRRPSVQSPYEPDGTDLGSNNWVVSGRLTQSGFPMMANDPHRAQAAPSLRYWTHLVGPGWNVIGGGEPEIPGVSIGHNEYGAWGLTVFQTDGEDLYVYDTRPGNLNEYRYQGRWEPMRVIVDTVAVKNESPYVVELKFTRHGPVVYQDEARHKAYAVRAAWMEIGGAPYLASLRMDQARTWEEFRDACSYSHIPGENMVWADVEGNIGWQAVGIAPIRPNWSGLVPVPGDGRYEWSGYLPIKDKPHVYNPPSGYFATANNNLIPPDYPHRTAVGWSWSDPFRWARANEFLGSGRKHSMMDMMRLQTDELSIPARTLVPLLEDLVHPDRRVEDARHTLLDWDFVLDKASVAAGLYVAWEAELARAVTDLFVPESARDYIRRLSMSRIIEWLIAPPGEFGRDPVLGRDSVLLQSLARAVGALQEKLGPDMTQWRYGQDRYKHALIRHPLTGAVDATTRNTLDVGPLPRGGNSYTLNNTGGGDNQRSGASFRIIVDTGDWDTAVGMNSPGQAGDPNDPHYRDLFPLWANDKFIPVFYSRERVEAVAGEVVVLAPER